MQTHCFDVDMAKKHGVSGAIIIWHLQFWIAKNRANKKHYHNGRTWTYNSVGALTKLFPYWSERQIRSIINKLISDNVLIVGDYNTKRNIRPKWYAFVAENAYDRTVSSVFDSKNACDQTVSSVFDSKNTCDQTVSSRLPNGHMHVTKRSHACDQTVSSLKETDNNHISKQIKTKNSLSGLSANARSAYRLLITHDVNPKTAKAIAYEQRTPLSTIENVIKNGLAKQDAEKDFTLRPGYIVEAINQARIEGKTIKPTNACRKLIDKFKNIVSPAPAKKITPTEFAKKKKAMVDALKIAAVKDGDQGHGGPDLCLTKQSSN